MSVLVCYTVFTKRRFFCYSSICPAMFVKKSYVHILYNKEFADARIIIWIMHSLHASIASTTCTRTNSSFGFFSSLFLIIFLCSSIWLAQLILLQRRFVRAEIYRGRPFFRAVRSLGEKQKDLTIVHFLNKLIVSCKESVRFPF